MAEKVAREFLQEIRELVRNEPLELNRLPGWVSSASVRIGWVNDSIVAVLEHGRDDDYDVRGPLMSDMALLLDIEDYMPTGALLSARNTRGTIVLVGELGDKKQPVFQITSMFPALFDCGYSGYHGPRIVFNVLLQHYPNGYVETGPAATRFIPLAFYIHKRDVSEETWEPSRERLLGTLRVIHDSPAGDFFENRQQRIEAFSVYKQTGVIILGKQTGVEGKELLQVRDALRGMGYEAFLLKELPETPEMAPEEKARLWTMACRFSVMVDRVPAGQIAEYGFLKEQSSVLAVLRTEGKASTFMISGSHLVDVNYIREFQFESSPLEVLGPAIEWAEGFVETRGTVYQEAYPWKKGQ